jgi:WD40 repeat protein
MNIRTVALIFLALSSMLVGAAHAQDDVQTIPIPGETLKFELSPDGSTIATYQYPGAGLEYEIEPDLLPIRFIDVATGDVRETAEGNSDYTISGAFSPDGATFATYHPNGYINLWNTSDGSLMKQIEALPGFNRIAYLNDGQTLLAVLGNPSGPGTVLLWDTESGAITRILTRRAESYAQWIENLGINASASNIADFTIAPDQNLLAWVTFSGQVSTVDLDSGEETVLREATDDIPALYVRDLMFTPDGQQLTYYDGEEKSLNFITLADGETTDYPMETALEGSSGNATFAFSPDGSQIALLTGGRNPVLYAADADQPDEPTPVELPELPGMVVQSSVTTLAYTADGTRLIIGGFYNEDNENGIVIIPVKAS